MISSIELESRIDDLLVSDVALKAFARRMAEALSAELQARAVVFHAINDGPSAFGHDGFDRACGVYLFKNREWSYEIISGMGYPISQSRANPISPTILSDSELKKITADWADRIAAISKHVVFTNLYVPRSVEFADGYNDLNVAFRVVRAWGVSLSGYVVRLDSLFKDLAA